MKRKVTKVMAEAAISAGADPNNLEVISDEEFAQLKADGELTAEELELEGNDGVPGDDGEEENAPTAEEFAAVNEQVETLTASLTESATQVESLTTQVADLEKQLEQKASDPLRKIAEDRISVMRVALGMTAIDMSGFGTDSLVAEYNALDTNFKKLYKPGGVGPTPKGEEEETKPQNITSIDAARLRAVGSF